MSNSLKLILLLAALLLCGCPAADTGAEDEANTAAPAVQEAPAADAAGSTAEAGQGEQPAHEESAAAAADPDEVTDEADEAPAESPESPADAATDKTGDESAATTGQGENSGVFDLGGLQLGISPPVYRVYYDSRPDITLVPTWIEQGLTGVITANLNDGSVSYGEVAYFLDGELVGVMRHEEEAAVQFADRTNELERRFGPPGEEPPRWARVTPFFSRYKKPEDGLVMKFWGNSRTREVIYAARNNAIGTTDYMLCDVDRFDTVSQQIQMGQYAPQG